MKKSIFAIAVLMAVLLVSNVFAVPVFHPNGNNNPAQTMEGSIVVKLKPGYNFNTQAPQAARNSGTKMKSGIGTLDNVLNTFNLQTINQPFAGHSTAKMPQSVNGKVNNQLMSNQVDLTRYYYLTFNSDANTQKIIKALESNPAVEYAEPRYIYKAFSMPNDDYYAYQFAWSQIMAPQAWDIFKGEQAQTPIIVGINDSGVQWDHPDLIDNLHQNLGEDADHDGHVIEFIDGKWQFDPGDINGIDDDGNGYADDFVGYNFYPYDGSAENDPTASAANEHGTHVAGISAGRTNNGTGISSVSWNVQFLPTKHGDNTGGESIYNPEEGLVYLVDNGAKVINCSWGGPGYSQFQQDVFNYCYQNNVVVVVAAGNENNSNVEYPSGYEHVISVSAVTAYDTRTYYSSFGIAPDVSAPGGDVFIDGGFLSTLPDNSYGFLQGTSMASPVVTGLAALIRSYHPEWSADQVMDRIIATTDNIDMNEPGFKNMLGSGRIDAYKALSESNPTLNIPLRLSLMSEVVNDANGNGVLEPGEEATFNFTIRNYAHGTTYNNAQCSLVSDDPHITIVNGTFTADIPADGHVDVNNVCRIKVSGDAQSEVAHLRLKITTPGKEMSWGKENDFSVLINNGGVLVYEPAAGKDFSGKYIANFLTANNINAIYTNRLPQSLMGFDAVFVSKGNYGTNTNSANSFWTTEELNTINNYLMNGGKCYIEGGVLADDEQVDPYYQMLNLLGVTDHGYSFDYAGFVPINADPNAITTGMTFTSSNQLGFYPVNDQILLDPNQNAVAAFTEGDLGIVAVQNASSRGNKSFYFSYALAELVDGEAPSTKTELLARICNFLGLNITTYAAADFTSDYRSGNAPSVVNFGDISQSNTPITSWAWDIGNDGTIESTDPNFTYTFENTGAYDVRLTISNGSKSWSVVKPAYIEVLNGNAAYSGSTVEDGAVCPNLSVTALPQAFTVEAWIKPNSFGPTDYGFGRIFDKGPFSFFIQTGGYLVFSAIQADGSSSKFQAGPDAIQLNQWQHVAVSVTADGSVSLYVNGEEKAYFYDYPYNGNPQDNENEYFVVGNRLDGTRSFDGKIDELRVWDVVRTPEEIKFGMNDQNQKDAAGLIGYWNFDNARGLEVSDMSGSGNDLVTFAGYAEGFPNNMQINLADRYACAGDPTGLGSYWVDKNNNVKWNTVVGGSGNYKYNWSLSGLLNPNSANPTFMNTYANTTFSLLAKDNTSGATSSMSAKLNVVQKATVNLPILLNQPKNTPLDLNAQITNYNPNYGYSWVDNWGNDVANPTNVICPVGLSKYYVTAWNENGCPSKTMRLVIFVSPLKEQAGEMAVGNSGRIVVASYPNPVTDYLNINADFDEVTPATIKVLDISGREVMRISKPSANNLNESLNVSNLVAGSYTLVVETATDYAGKQFIIK